MCCAPVPNSAKHNPDHLLVRARRKQDLLGVCGNDVEVLKHAATDYRWRTFVGRKAFSALVGPDRQNQLYERREFGG